MVPSTAFLGRYHLGIRHVLLSALAQLDWKAPDKTRGVAQSYFPREGVVQLPQSQKGLSLYYNIRT